MIDITDCRDLDSLQAVIFMVIFLQCSARLSTCYTHIGIALRSAIRMGLHRSLPTHFDPIERESRKRVFWSIRTMDIYVATLLGLPKSLSDKDIDQDLPAPVDDRCITLDGIQPMPQGAISLQAGANAQTRLVKVMTTIIKHVYPIKGVVSPSDGHGTHSYMVSHAKVREIEQNLHEWTDQLPAPLHIGAGAPRHLAR